jgi:hypothetical protein
MTTYLDNPFYQLPLRSGAERYYGSRAWAELILQGASGTPPRSFDLLGLPGMGKSSLLRYIAASKGALEKEKKALQHPFDEKPSKIFPVLTEFRLLPTDVHPFVYLAERYFDEYKGYRERHGGAKSPLPDLKWPGDNRTPETAAVSVEDALMSLGERGVRAILLLDDFHLAFERLSLAETTRLRPWRENAAFVLSTERPLNKVNANAAGSPFFQTLSLVPFGGLTVKEARRILDEPAAQAGWPFHPKDIDFTLEHAGAHPRLLITAGGALWEVREGLGVTRDRNVAVSKDHASVLIGHYKERFTPTFEMYLEHLEEKEQEALKAMVAGDASTAHQPALAYLMKLGLAILTPAGGGGYRPFSPLFGEFIEAAGWDRPEERIVDGSGVEAKLLEYMTLRRGAVCTFEELSRNVWGEGGGSGQDRAAMQRRIQVAVSRLRKRLQESSVGDVRSVRGQGYKLVGG